MIHFDVTWTLLIYYLLICEGIAVGAGELGEEEAKALAQTERKLASVQSELSATRQENQRLNAQLASLRGVSEIGETSQ